MGRPMTLQEAMAAIRERRPIVIELRKYGVVANWHAARDKDAFWKWLEARMHAGDYPESAYGRTWRTWDVPPEIVARMCDMLEAESPGAFEPDKTFLEPTCGDGAFVVEILRRKFDRCRTRGDYTVALDSVYGLEVQAANVVTCIERVTALCREYFRPTAGELRIIEDHYIMCDSLKIMRMMSDERLRP